MEEKHITQAELARRWRLSPRTLERWRWLGKGPAYLKIGGRIVYRKEDVAEFEIQRRKTSASMVLEAGHRQKIFASRTRHIAPNRLR
jgi:hypothetical protein